MNEEQEKALQELIHDYKLGDFVYAVRENTDLSDLPDEKSSWDHPRVKRFGEIVKTLTEMVTPPDISARWDAFVQRCEDRNSTPIVECWDLANQMREELRTLKREKS